MRWFKKKPTPFDSNFEIAVETPEDHGGTQELLFEVPYNYYAQIISVTLTIDPPLLITVGQNYVHFEVQRGGVVLFRSMSNGAVNRGGAPFISAGAVGFTGIDAFSLTRISCWPIPDYCYVYPHDLVRVFIPFFTDVITLSDLRIVMKVWRTD